MHLKDVLNVGISMALGFTAKGAVDAAAASRSSQCFRSDGIGYSEAANPNAGIGEKGFEWAPFDGTINNYWQQRISGFYQGEDGCYYPIDTSKP